MIGIYKITNTINQKCYIGQSENIKRRWKDHKKDAFWENGPDYEYPLYRAIRKYGIDKFVFEVLEECLPEELDNKEVLYIQQYHSFGQNGYNQNEGGNHQTQSKKLTPEDVAAIIYRLKTTFDPLSLIAKDYGVGITTLHNINVGDAYCQQNETYPIRPKVSSIRPSAVSRKNPTCPDCGAKTNRIGNKCVECAKSYRREHSKKHTFNLSPMELAKKIVDYGFEGVGREYGVSGKSITQWCTLLHLPHKKKELREWYNKQTQAIPTSDI